MQAAAGGQAFRSGVLGHGLVLKKARAAAAANRVLSPLPRRRVFLLR
jgi:hypothetical protein